MTRVIRRVVQEPGIPCGELKKDLEVSGRFVSKRTSNILDRNGLYACSPHKTPILNKKHIKACLKFDAENLDKLERENDLVR